ncbi:ATP-binding cassette domain-containing protein [Breoghania sp.]|uniref:ATP-binding cassette domain-containing protein n=1 Tax=Breoghania sp. TaxID=2065378 RepID=UPI002610D81F|nr:ATP-binding cassette domain-containing protein [Breoghania sp.]MDJ0930605.1 ATP-binding cassette domain-containing protein [Breoghania sp.]
MTGLTASQDPSGSTFVLSDLSFAVKGRTLLHPLSLALSGNGVTGLIGHNGSGKSTLLKLLAPQHAPSAGTIRFHDRDLKAWGQREFARKLAYLPQQAPSASGLLVRELIALGRYPWYGAIGRFGSHDRQKVDEAMEMTSLVPFADRLVDTLSGGERQRVWIAMAMAQDASCLLLDEPTSALDIAHQIEVLSLIACLAHERALAVVVVLHDVNMAARYCDEVLALHSGHLIARDDPHVIMEPAMLEKIYGTRMDVVSHGPTGHTVAIPL